MKKIEGGHPFRDFKKIEKKSINENFKKCHSAEECKRGDPLGFFNMHSVAKETIEDGTLWCNPKTSKKVS